MNILTQSIIGVALAVLFILILKLLKWINHRIWQHLTKEDRS